jgi:alkaline phosphatase
MKRLLILVLLSLPALAPVAASQGTARNVILFLADAAGIPTLNAASIHGYGENRRLFVQRMPHIGLSDTATASQMVTDSAAGMTAIVTGQRTHNGVIGMGADAVRNQRDGTPLTTILEMAEARGLSTGLISNDALTGATPASLYAKVNERNKTAEIFRQLFLTRAGDGPDVMIGSGRAAVVNALKAEGTTIEAVAAQHTRPVLESLEAVPDDATRAIVLVQDRNFDLAVAVRMARRILSANPRGYFLMVEADAHTDALRPGLERLLVLDRVIEETAGDVGSDTLVLFTADHSFDLRVHGGTWGKPLLTGAAAESGGGMESVSLSNVRMNNDHTAEEVLVAAQGPGSQNVRGYMANTDIFHVMLSAFGWSGPGDRP